MFVEVYPATFANLAVRPILRVDAVIGDEIVFAEEDSVAGTRRIQLSVYYKGIGDALIIELMKRIDEGRRVIFHKEFSTMLEEIREVFMN